MADWAVIELDDVKAHLVAAQVEALDKSGLGVGQGTRFDEALPRVAARVRAKIMSSPRNLKVSATESSVPPELVLATVYLLIQAIQPGLQIPLTADQQAQVAQAERDLERIADGKETVTEPSDPLTPTPAQAGGWVSVVSANGREATREKMGGI
jgi:hypothetical protein